MSRSRRVVSFVLALTAVTASATARERAEAPAAPASTAQEVTVVAVVRDQHTQLPLVVLEGKRDKRTLAMVIGPAEATGIAVPLQGTVPPRPLTHDLFLTLFGRLSVTVSRAVIHDLREGTYYATLHMAGGGGPFTLDSRPSDAIALALRARAPVLVEDRVFDKSERETPAVRRPHI